MEEDHKNEKYYKRIICYVKCYVSFYILSFYTYQNNKSLSKLRIYAYNLYLVKYNLQNLNQSCFS